MMAGSVGPKVRMLPLMGYLVALGVATLVGSNVWVALAARNHACRDLSSVPTRSVAIVPGSSTWRGQPGSALRGRLEAALALYREGRVRAILVSGNDRATAPEATVMRAWLEARGVPNGAIRSDGLGSRTRETMLHAAERFNVTDAIVCTQTLFMPRTLFLAQQAGIDATGLALPSPLSRSPRFVGKELLKTTLAFFESYLRKGPQSPAGALATESPLAQR
jgi:vancomycin permeability regulator SanA